MIHNLQTLYKVKIWKESFNIKLFLALVNDSQI